MDMSTAANMRKILKTYLDSVDATLKELEELGNLADVFSGVLDENDEINLEIQDAHRKINHLQSKRTDLYEQYHQATFNGSYDRVISIENERDSIDERIAELQATIEESQDGLRELDAVAVADMLARTSNARAPIFSNRLLHFQQNTLRTGLVDQLEEEHKSIADEINAKKRYVLDMREWYRYSDKATLRREAPETASVLIGA